MRLMGVLMRVVMRMNGAVCMVVLVRVGVTVIVLMLMLVIPERMGILMVVRGFAVAMTICGFDDDVDLGSGEAAAHDLANFETRTDVQGCCRLLKRGEGHARVDQGAEEHVSTDAGKAVEIGNSHQRKL